MSDNAITITGNLTRAPELKFLNSGKSTAKLSVAHNKVWKDRNGDKQEKVSFFEVVCYAPLSDNVAQSLDKGTSVVIVGRLEQRSWETEDGTKRHVVEIIADEVSPSLRYASAQVTKNERHNAPTSAPADDDYAF